MTVKELLSILNNKDEIPSPEHAEIFFYFTNESGEDVDLELDSVGAFNISTDITFTFIKGDTPPLIRPSVMKSDFKN